MGEQLRCHSGAGRNQKYVIPSPEMNYRGRDGALVCPAPPSEPDWRISRIRLSGWWFYLGKD